MTEKRRAGIIANALLAATGLSPGCASPPASDSAGGNATHTQPAQPAARRFLAPDGASFGPPHRDGSIFTDDKRREIATLMVGYAIEQHRLRADFADGKITNEALKRATADTEGKLAAALAPYINQGIERGYAPEAVKAEIEEINAYVQSRSTAGNVAMPRNNNGKTHRDRSR